MTLQSQGIVVEGGAAEVSTDAGQPQVHEEDEEHLDKTNQSNCSTVNQNSDSVKTFRDKKHRL